MSLVLLQHPFAMYCWKALIALYERDVPFTAELVEADRSALAALWPPASIPVLVDDSVVVAESSIIVEHLDRHGDAPPLIPTDPDEALQARLWDRVTDGYVTTPVQRIVGDARAAKDIVAVLRSAVGRDPHDRALSDLIGELATKSEVFRTHWASHNVHFHLNGPKHFHHPVVGDLSLNFERLDLAADSGLTIFTYTAEPGSGRPRMTTSRAPTRAPGFVNRRTPWSITH